MTAAQWMMVAGVLAALFLLMAAVRTLGKKRGWSAEVQRKAVHMGMGLATLGFPWMFDGPLPVVVLGLLAVGALLALRLVPVLRRSVGEALHGVDRPSYGDLFFSVSVMLVFVLSEGDPVEFCVPILILTFADAAGALIGVAYGRNSYATLDGKKSAEGSMTFFLVCFLVAHIPLLLFADLGRLETLLISFIIAVMVMMVEAISARGIDNLVIPLAGWYLLSEYTQMGQRMLVERFVVVTILLVFVLAVRKKSSLDGSSLLGSVLFGYGCWALGGWPYVIIPMGFFISHLLATHKVRRESDPRHDLVSILSVGITGMVWLIAVKWSGDAEAYLWPFAVGMSVHFAIRNLATVRFLRPEAPEGFRIIRSSAKAGLFCFLPLLLVFDADKVAVLSGIGLAVSVVATFVFSRMYPIKGRETSVAPGRWAFETVLALVCSGLLVALLG